MTIEEFLATKEPTAYIIGNMVYQSTVARWHVADGVFYWCSMFPQDQHHTHSIPFETSRVFYDRDLGLYRGSELLVYAAPWNEWPGMIDPNEYFGELDRWKKHMSDPKRRASFDRFYTATTEMPMRRIL